MGVYLYIFVYGLSVIAVRQVAAGVEVEVIKPGDGISFPSKGQTVSVYYVGTLEDGTVFDSSRASGAPFQFELGVRQVIQCLDEGVAYMSVGQKVILTCTPNYAYGERGYPGIIPPNATLKFEVELLRFSK